MLKDWKHASSFSFDTGSHSKHESKTWNTTELNDFEEGKNQIKKKYLFTSYIIYSPVRPFKRSLESYWRVTLYEMIHNLHQ